MRKFGIFVLSFAASAVLFVIVAVAVLLLSGTGKDIIDRLSGTEKESAAPKLSVNADNEQAYRVLVMYWNDGAEDNYFTVCELSDGLSTFAAHPINLAPKDKARVQSLASEGLVNSVAEAVCEAYGINVEYFIKFDSESFAKTADRMNGVVYNDNGSARLLTGGQAVQLLNSELLAQSCSQFWDTAAGKNAIEEFFFLTETTEHNLSIKSVYELLF